MDHRCTARSWGHCGPGEEAKGTEPEESDSQVPSPASMLLPIEIQAGPYIQNSLLSLTSDAIIP